MSRNQLKAAIWTGTSDCRDKDTELLNTINQFLHFGIVTDTERIIGVWVKFACGHTVDYAHRFGLLMVSCFWHIVASFLLDLDMKKGTHFWMPSITDIIIPAP